MSLNYVWIKIKKKVKIWNGEVVSSHNFTSAPKKERATLDWKAGLPSKISKVCVKFIWAFMLSHAEKMGILSPLAAALLFFSLADFFVEFTLKKFGAEGMQKDLIRKLG